MERSANVQFPSMADVGQNNAQPFSPASGTDNFRGIQAAQGKQKQFLPPANQSMRNRDQDMALSPQFNNRKVDNVGLTRQSKKSLFSIQI
jgi:hypothetical protein